MSNVEIDDDDEEVVNEGGLPALRDAAAKGRASLAENVRLRKALLFARSGIDIKDNELGKMLFQTWDGGDDSDAELKATAERLGIIGEKPPAPEVDPAAAALRAGEDQQRQQMHEGMAGGQPAGQAPPQTDDPRDTSLAEYQQAIRAGTPEDQARTDAIAKVLGAGGGGDKRVIFDQEQWSAKAAEADLAATGRRPV